MPKEEAQTRHLQSPIPPKTSVVIPRRSEAQTRDLKSKRTSRRTETASPTTRPQFHPQQTVSPRLPRYPRPGSDSRSEGPLNWSTESRVRFPNENSQATTSLDDKPETREIAERPEVVHGRVAGVRIRRWIFQRNVPLGGWVRCISLPRDRSQLCDHPVTPHPGSV